MQLGEGFGESIEVRINVGGGDVGAAREPCLDDGGGAECGVIGIPPDRTWRGDAGFFESLQDSELPMSDLRFVFGPVVVITPDYDAQLCAAAFGDVDAVHAAGDAAAESCDCDDAATGDDFVEQK